MAKFQPAVAFVLKNEGGLESNPQDAGEITNYGISLRFYRSTIQPDATADDIRNLSVAAAEHIYETQFWQKNRYDEIDSQLIASKMLDLSVNCGSLEANKFLQRAIENISPGAVTIDGIFGIRTIAAANAIDERRLYNQLILQALDYYQNILIAHPEDRVFYKGWVTRLNSIPS